MIQPIIKFIIRLMQTGLTTIRLQQKQSKEGS